MEGDLTYEVVSLDDAAALALDAADAALESQGFREDSELGVVAESAADAAASAAIDAALDRVDGTADELADAAASAAVSGVRDEITATLDRIEQRSAELQDTAVEVTIASDQYDALFLQLRVMAGAEFLSLCICSAILGALVWSTVIRGFR